MPEESEVFITADIILRVSAALGNKVLQLRAPHCRGFSADQSKHPKLGGYRHSQLPDISTASIHLTPDEVPVTLGIHENVFLLLATWPGSSQHDFRLVP